MKEVAIDALENSALEFGWRGKKWREPLPDEASEHLRKLIFPPFENFYARLAKIYFKPNGVQLAGALRELWNDLKVEPTLERWTFDEENSSLATYHLSHHATVLDQMNLWLENLELAFPDESLPLREWLPILEAGLANLTVGVVPPALDQVLIGAIDRARNPDLKLVLVLGVNETIFPATPTAQTILTDADRAELTIPLGPDLRERLARECYYGYIACTRASKKLIITFSRSSADGNALNPSPFIAHLKQIFPGLEVEEFAGEIKLADAENLNEIAPLIFGMANPELRTQSWTELLQMPAIAALKDHLGVLREPDEKENLSAALAENFTVTRCGRQSVVWKNSPRARFGFFVRSGLRADERKVFELDARERGSFQHDVLKMFHEQLVAEGKRWRDIESTEARERIGKIAATQTEHFRDGCSAIPQKPFSPHRHYRNRCRILSRSSWRGCASKMNLTQQRPSWRLTTNRTSVFPPGKSIWAAVTSWHCTDALTVWICGATARLATRLRWCWITNQAVKNWTRSWSKTAYNCSCSRI